MSRSIKDWCIIFLLLIISLLCPIVLYTCSQIELIHSLEKTSASYLQLFTCESVENNSQELQEKRKDVENISNLVQSCKTSDKNVEKEKICSPNTTILDFLTQHCSRIHIYLPIQDIEVTAEVEQIQNGTFSSYVYSKLKSQKQVAKLDDKENEKDELEPEDKENEKEELKSDDEEYEKDELEPKESHVDNKLKRLFKTKNCTEKNCPEQEKIDEKADDFSEIDDEGVNEDISDKIRPLPGPPLDGALLNDEFGSVDMLDVAKHVGSAIKNTALIVIKHAVKYPKDVCIVIVVVIALIKFATWLSGEYRTQSMLAESSDSGGLITTSRASSYSDEELKQDEIKQSSVHTLESVRHLLPAESQPIIPCTVMRQAYQSASSSETCNVRGIPDTFTILKNMPADIDVADIYLDTFRRMALQAGKVKTANLLKESQMFLEFRRNSYIKNNLSQNAEISDTPLSSHVIPADSIVANLSTESQEQ